MFDAPETGIRDSLRVYTSVTIASVIVSAICLLLGADLVVAVTVMSVIIVFAEAYTYVSRPRIRAKQSPQAFRLDRYFVSRVVSLSRKMKIAIMMSVDLLAFLAALLLSAWLVDHFDALSGLLLVWSGTLTLLAMALVGTYRVVTRYGSTNVRAAAEGSTLSTVGVVFVMMLVGTETAAFRIPLVFGLVLFLYVLGSRAAAKALLNRGLGHAKSVVIYGAGSAGRLLATGLSFDEAYVPIAFVDDDERLQNSVADGLKVFAPRDLPSLISEFDVSEVLLAVPSVTGSRRRTIIEALSALRVRVRTVPGVSDLVAGRATIEDLRDLEVDDILGRDTARSVANVSSTSLNGKTILVAGAGGSVGSEICRQLLSEGPERIVLFDVSEAALYEVEREIRQLSNKRKDKCDVLVRLGSVTQEQSLAKIMSSFDVDTVYNVAGYRHVPIVEQNVLEGAYVNIFGALCTANAAIEAGVKTVIQVSTDKAGSPTTVVGASKRFSEMILQALHDVQRQTRLSSIRVGNLIESSGSVTSLFRKQIRAGGPVTVTHPDIVRYFMTVPEAAQLVLQAGGLSRGGEVYVMDMGMPVKIYDLACRMINLLGLSVRDYENPDGDIEIVFTGLRPLEKLYEDKTLNSNLHGTEHPRIMRAEENYMAWGELEPKIHQVRQAYDSMDSRGVLSVLQSVVEGYSPQIEAPDLNQGEQPTLDFEGLGSKSNPRDMSNVFPIRGVG
jgi:FlaA1/EpsC-like NDP-sugar epimerase